MERAVTVPAGPVDVRRGDRVSVLGLLVRRELQDLLRRSRTRVTLSLIVISMVLSAVTYGARHHGETRAYEEASRRYELVLEETSHHLDSLAVLYHPAIKPPWQLAFAADGGQLQGPNVDRRVLSAWFAPELVRMPPIRPYRYDDPPPIDLPLGLDGRLAETEPLDWLFVIRVILSLAAFVLGYDALCGRRQRALLRLTLSYTVGRGQALVAKLLALWTCLSAPFLAGAAMSVAIVIGYGGIELSSEELGKIAVVLLCGLVGSGFFVLIALLVSSLTRSAARALSILALVWVAAVVAIPAAAALVAQVNVRMPTEQEIAQRMDEIRRKVETELGEGSNWRRPKWAAKDDYDAERRAAQIQNERSRRQEEERRRIIDQQLEQAEQACRLASISPLFLVQEIAQRMVGSGLLRDRAFVRQARVFGGELSDRVRELDARDPDSPNILFFFDYFSKKSVSVDEIPRFDFREPSLAEGLRRALPWLILLLLEIAAVALLLHFFFVRDHLR